MGNFLPRVSNKRKLDSSDESVVKRERTDNVSPIEKVQVQIDDTNAETKGIEKEIKDVGKEIKGVGKDIKGIEKKLENSKELWNKMDSEDRAVYYNKRSKWVQHLNDEKKELRDEKNKLRDKENKLLDKEKKLLAQGTTSELKRSRTIYPFTHYTGIFQETTSSHTFEFVGVPTLENIITLLTETFSQWHIDDRDKRFGIPIITGGSGSGKTRLGHEASKRMKDVVRKSMTKSEKKNYQNAAATIFVNCRDIQFVVRGETVKNDAEKVLAQALLKSLNKDTRWENYDYTLSEVLDKMANDMKAKTFFLQLDEYASNPYFVELAVHVCNTKFRPRGSQIALIPILTGIPLVHLSAELVKVSDKVVTTTFTLSGVDDVAGLKESFLKEVGQLTNPPSTLTVTNHMKGPLANLCDMLGSLPVLYLFLYLHLEKSKKLLSCLVKKTFTSEHGKAMLESIAARYRSEYGVHVWAACFLNDVDKYNSFKERRYSDKTLEMVLEHIKRVHTMAISGVSILLMQQVVPEFVDDKAMLTMSYAKLSSSGMFTLLDAGEHRGTIVMAPLAIYALVDQTNACDKRALSVFEYSPETQEVVAMAALQCRWNGLYYSNGVCLVPYWELRPGALHKGKSKDVGSKVTIEEPLKIPQRLALNINNPRGGEYEYSDKTIAPLKIGNAYLCAKDEPRIDGFALFENCRFWSQTKSAQLVCPKTTGGVSKTKIYTSEVKKIVAGQEEHMVHAVVSYTTPPMDVYDVFTNRLTGNVKLPTGKKVLLTHRGNFRQVVGPVIGQIANLLVDGDT